MIEAYIERICAAVRDSFGERTSLAIAQLSAILPPDALAWCKADALEQLNAEWNEGGPTGRIRHASPDSARVVHGALTSLIPFFEYEQTLALLAVRQAMQFASGYVMRPRRTLADQVFRGASSVSHELLATRLSAAVEYQYLPSILLRTFSGRDEIRRPEFESSAAAIDDAAVDQHSPDEFARLMAPIARWSALAGGDPESVPVPALLEFLADKNLQVLYNYISSITRIRSRSDLRFGEIAALVRDIEVNDIGVMHAASPSPSESLVDERPEAEPLPNPAEETIDEEPLSPEAPPQPEPPVAEIPVPEPVSEPVPAPPRAETPPEVTEPMIQDSEPEPPPKLIQKAIAAEPVVPAHDAAPTLPERTFAPELRTSLSNSLFHGNVTYFDVTVNELSRMDTWREAASYLTDLLELNRLNPYASDVMQFTDTIRKWFIRDDEDPAS